MSLYNYTLTEEERERHRYLCPICGWANDPKVYAMEKLGKRWYHWICLQKASFFFLKHFDFKLGKNLKPVYCKRREKKKQEIDYSNIHLFFSLVEGK